MSHLSQPAYRSKDLGLDLVPDLRTVPKTIPRNPSLNYLQDLANRRINIHGPVSLSIFEIGGRHFYIFGEIHGPFGSKVIDDTGPRNREFIESIQTRDRHRYIQYVRENIQDWKLVHPLDMLLAAPDDGCIDACLEHPHGPSG